MEFVHNNQSRRNLTTMEHYELFILWPLFSLYAGYYTMPPRSFHALVAYSQLKFNIISKQARILQQLMSRCILAKCNVKKTLEFVISFCLENSVFFPSERAVPIVSLFGILCDAVSLKLNHETVKNE